MRHDSPDAVEMRVPPRLWWLKRLAGAYVLFVLAVGGLRYWADRVSQRKLDAEVAALRAKGEPILVEDFYEPEVADEDNAAAYLNRAAAAIKIDKNDETAFDNVGRTIPLSSADMQLLDRIIPQNRQALDLVRQARSKSAVNWHLKLESPAITILLPHLNHQRELANLLTPAALWAHQCGDDAAAVEYVRDILAISRAVERQPFLLSHLVAGGTLFMASNVMQQIAPGLKNATAEQMRGLLADLLDEGPLRRGFVAAMQGERMGQFDTLLSLAQARAPGAWIGAPPMSRGPSYLFRPILLKDARGILFFGNAFVDATRQEDLSGTMAKMPVLPTGMARWRQPFAGLLLPALGGAATRHYTIIRTQRQAAMALAERMYELEHGRKAAVVEELSPQYLPAVLEDPMAAKGVKLGLSGGK